MSQTHDAEAEAIRRRYALVFGDTPEGAKHLSLDLLREMLAGADAQRKQYLSMGFEVDDPADEARRD